MVASIILILLTLYVLTILHELGHFTTAKLLGFQVPIFGIGLPVTPHLTFLKAGGTEFRMHLVPIGVYASIPELDPPGDDGQTADSLAKPFRQFPLAKKLLVVVSGIATSFFLALIIFNASFMLLGVPETKVVVEELSDENPMARDAGVLKEDEILALNSVKPKTAEEVVGYLKNHPKETVNLVLLREGKEVQCPLTTNEAGKVGMMIRVDVDTSKPVRYLSLVESNQHAFNMLGSMSGAIPGFVGSRISPNNSGTENQQTNLGWIGIAALLAQDDPRKLSLLAAMLCFDFALLYCLPLPGLDGSHLISVTLNHFRKTGWESNKTLRWLRVVCLTLVFVAGSYAPCLLRGRIKDGK
jgi:regulator of sigma E protease